MTQTAETAPVKKAETKAAAGGSPWQSLVQLRHDMDRMFEELSSQFLAFPSKDIEPLKWFGKGDGKLTPAMDVVETDKDFQVTAEVPGMDEKDIEVTVSGGTLTIKGEKREQKEEKKKDYYLSERRYGSFQRSWRLPESVDSDKIEAKFTKGVLTVTAPKKSESVAKEKKIAIAGQ